MLPPGRHKSVLNARVSPSLHAALQSRLRRDEMLELAEAPCLSVDEQNGEVGTVGAES